MLLLRLELFESSNKQEDNYMPTIKDIAREAGVSHGTVSNVLNKTGKVSIEKIRLVEEAAKRLGYVPNAQAQALRQGTPDAIAIILPSLSENIYLDLYSSLQISFHQTGYEVLIYTTDDIAGKEESIFNQLPTSRLAAVVTASCLGKQNNSLYSTLPCPVIQVDREVESISSHTTFISFPFSDIGKEIANYILEHNWKKIAFFSAPITLTHTKQLFQSFQETLKEHSALVHSFSSDFNLAINKAFDMIRESNSFDVIVTTSTLRAEAVIDAMNFSFLEKRPTILSIGSRKHFPCSSFYTYELDYSYMGLRISELILNYLQHQMPLPNHISLSTRGFSKLPYHFHRKKNHILTMLTLDTPSTNALDKLVPLFEATSGIQLKLTSMPYEDLHAQINLLNNRFHYDLIRMDVARFDTLGSKTYLPLAEAGITPDTLPAKLIDHSYDNYSYTNGKAYALPFDPSVQIFLYRSDLFCDALLSRAYYEKYRETLSIPTTIEQFLRVAEFFSVSQNPFSPTRYGTTLTVGSASTVASDFLPYYLSRTHKICDTDGKIRLNTPDMIEAMKDYLKIASYASQQQWWLDSVRQFADGTAATTTIYSNYAAYVINSKHSNVVGKIGASFVPGRHPLLGGGLIGICRYSKNLEYCRQFFHWYYSPDTASRLVRLGGTSPLTDAYSDFKNFHIFPWLSTSKDSFSIGTRGSDSNTTFGFSIQHYEFSIGTAIRSLLAGTTTPSEAAAMAQQLYESKSITLE